jgi:hypothetical protein
MRNVFEEITQQTRQFKSPTMEEASEEKEEEKACNRD